MRRRIHVSYEDPRSVSLTLSTPYHPHTNTHTHVHSLSLTHTLSHTQHLIIHGHLSPHINLLPLRHLADLREVTQPPLSPIALELDKHAKIRNSPHSPPLHGKDRRRIERCVPSSTPSPPAPFSRGRARGGRGGRGKCSASSSSSSEGISRITVLNAAPSAAPSAATPLLSVILSLDLDVSPSCRWWVTVVLDFHIWSGHVPPPPTLGLVPAPCAFRRRRMVAPAGVIASLPLYPRAALARHRPLPLARHRPQAFLARWRPRCRALALHPGAPLARDRPFAIFPPL